MKKVIVFIMIMLLSVIVITIPSFAGNGAAPYPFSRDYLSVIVPDSNDRLLVYDGSLDVTCLSSFSVYTSYSVVKCSALPVTLFLSKFHYSSDNYLSCTLPSVLSGPANYNRRLSIDVSSLEDGENYYLFLLDDSEFIVASYSFVKNSSCSGYVSLDILKPSYKRGFVINDSDIYMTISDPVQINALLSFSYPSETYDAILCECVTYQNYSSSNIIPAFSIRGHDYGSFPGNFWDNSTVYALGVNESISGGSYLFSLSSCADYSGQGFLFFPYAPLSCNSDLSVSVAGRFYGVKFVEKSKDALTLEQLMDPSSDFHQSITDDFSAALNNPNFGSTIQSGNALNESTNNTSNFLQSGSNKEDQIMNDSVSGSDTSQFDNSIKDVNLLAGLKFWREFLEFSYDSLPFLKVLFGLCVSIGVLALIVGIRGRIRRDDSEPPETGGPPSVIEK